METHTNADTKPELASPSKRERPDECPATQVTGSTATTEETSPSPTKRIRLEEPEAESKTELKSEAKPEAEDKSALVDVTEAVRDRTVCRRLSPPFTHSFTHTGQREREREREVPA